MWLERMEQRTAIVEGSGNEPAQRPAGPFASPWFQLAKALGAGRIIALGLVACTLLGFFAYIVGRATDDSYTLLFSGLALTDAQELVGRLEAMGTPYRLSPGGDAILVPSGDALRLRMALAEEGMPVGGTVGYALLDRANPFTTSDFLANVDLRRAIEGELARTIGTLRSVRSARVHIVVPERAMFGRDQPKATASIVLTLRGPDALDKRQIAGYSPAGRGSRAGLGCRQRDPGRWCREPAGGAERSRCRGPVGQRFGDPPRGSRGPPARQAGEAPRAFGGTRQGRRRRQRRSRLRRDRHDRRAVRAAEPGRPQYPEHRGKQRSDGEPARRRGR